MPRKDQLEMQVDEYAAQLKAADATISRLTRERDAAIRERDEANERRAETISMCEQLRAETSAMRETLRSEAAAGSPLSPVNVGGSDLDVTARRDGHTRDLELLRAEVEQFKTDCAVREDALYKIRALFPGGHEASRLAGVALTIGRHDELTRLRAIETAAPAAKQEVFDLLMALPLYEHGPSAPHCAKLFGLILVGQKPGKAGG